MVQEPGQVLYIPQGLPHAIHNLDNNIALTRNQLFSVGHITITLRAGPYMTSYMTSRWALGVGVVQFIRNNFD